MKTQVRRLTQWISAALIIGLIIWPKSGAFAYTSINPWQNEAGPEQGLIFTPKLGVLSAGNSDSQDSGTSNANSNTVDFDLNVNASLGDGFSAYGRYSNQTDQIFGFSDRLFKNRNFEISAQAEVTDSHESVVGFTGGIFLSMPTHLLGLGEFTTEFGVGYHSDPSKGVTFVPASFLLKHNPEISGIYYAAGLSGESATTTTDGWISIRTLAGYETKNGIRYGVEAAIPATTATSQNATAIAFNLVVPFGAKSKSFEDAPVKAVPELSTDLTPHYDLNAKVISMNEALFLIKIDKGSSDSIEKGQTFDIYSNENRMARAQVIAVKKDEAALNVIEYNQEYWIELGFSARRVSRSTE